MTTKEELLNKLKTLSKSEENKDRFVNVIRQFKSTPVELKVSFASEILRLFDCLPKFSTASTKIVAKSTEFRKQGNFAYILSNTGKEDVVALACYIRSIAYARENSEELAVAYANRSAVLYRLQEFHYALIDVNRALNGKLSEVVRFKLKERKKKCINKINEDNKYEMMFSSLHIAHLHPCMQRVIWEAMKKALQFNQDETESMYFKKPAIPLLHRKNPTLTDVSVKVKLSFHKEKGRCLVANKNIEPGELLLVEKPYAAILSSKYTYTHCARCFVRCLTLIPCGGCSKVMFCTQKCRDESLISFHRVECQIMPTLLRMQLNDKEILALRMVLIATKQGEDLKSFANYPIFQDCSTKSAPLKKKNTKKSNQKPKKQSKRLKNAYDKINNLTEGLAELLNDEMTTQLTYWSIVAALLLHVLKSSSYFTKTVQNGLDVHTIPEEMQQLVGNLLLKHLLMLNLNGEQMVEWIQHSDTTPYMGEIIGEALYPTFSFINHSCDPNVTELNYQDSVVVRAVQPIAAGEEIVTCYGQSFGVCPRQQRQEHCKKFNFECDCDPCKFDWPLYEQLSNKNLSNKTDEKKLNEYAFRFKEMMKKAENIGTESFDKFICEYVSLMHKCVKKPSKNYYDCLEKYRLSLISRANCYSTFDDVLLETNILTG